MASQSGKEVPAFVGRGAHFLDFEHQVHLRVRTTHTEVFARDSSLVLHMQPVPRQVCLAEGGDILDHSDGVAKFLGFPRNYFAQEAVGAIRRQARRFARPPRANQRIDECSAEYDLRRRKAESKMEMGAGPPERLASILHMGSAASSRNEKSSVMASSHKCLRFEDASANMRRLIG